MKQQATLQQLPAKFHKRHPYRAPDWRWRHVFYGPSDDEDSFISLARDFYTETCELGPNTASLFARYPTLYPAWEIYSDSSSLQKAEMEARLLSREDVASIATKLGLDSEETVIYYEALFYNVLEKLDYPSYILHHALDGAYPDVLKTEAGRWKFFGYWCGPGVLDLLIYRGAPTNLSDESFDNYLTDFIKKKLMVALTVSDFKDKKDLLKLLEIYLRKAETVASGPTETTIIGKLNEVLLSMKFGRLSEVRPTSISIADIVNINSSHEQRALPNS